MLLYIIAIVLGVLVTIILGFYFFRWLNEFVLRHSGFEILELKMILLLFCCLVLCCFTAVAYNSFSNASGYCWKATKQWFGTTEQGQEYSARYIASNTTYNVIRNVQYSQYPDNPLTACTIPRKIMGKEWIILIFLGTITVITLLIPLVNGIQYGGWGIFGFLVQLFLAVVILTVVILITAFLSSRRSKKEPGH